MPAEPTGAPLRKWSGNVTLGNTKKGGRLWPTAETAAHTVTSVHRSADTSIPTCLAPVVATLLFGFCTIVIPVSSTFHISLASHLCLSMTLARVSLNISTVGRLKAVAHPMLVTSGVLMDRLGCRLRNPAKQSHPTRPISLQLRGMGMAY